jgi:uncharacterized delta-60 repeat protein
MALRFGKQDTASRLRLEHLEGRDVPAAIGALDPSFGTGGLVTTDFGAVDQARAVAVQPDGKIVAAGVGTGNVNFAVARYNPDGSPDPTFGGGDGLIDIPVTIGDAATGVAVQPDGRIVVVGFTDDGVDTDFAAVRVLADGSGLDLSLSGDGQQTVAFGGTDTAVAVALQPDGKIVVAGSTTAGSDFALARLMADGSLDTSFNTTGKVTPTFGGVDTAAGVVVQPDGKVVVAGLTNIGGGVPDNFAILRLNANGSLDPSFSVTGKATVDFGGDDDEAAAVALDPNGRVVLAGTSGGNFAVARLTGTVEQARRLAVGGSLDGTAQAYTPDPATGNYAAAGPVAGLGATAANARVAVGDVNGDGAEDTVLVTGPGTAIRLAVVSGKDGTTQLVAPFDPLGGDFTGGGFVAAADFDNDGRAEIVVTPDRGGGPRVVIFSLGTSGTFAQRASFFGIDDPDFRGGARAGAGDVDADGVADLAVAAGFLGGPRVALFDGGTVFGTPTRLVGDFLAFEDVLRNGVYVAIGDVTGDGFGDLIFGAGPGGAPRVLTVSGKALLTTGAVAAIASPVSNFFVAGNAADRGGVRVASTDTDGDGRAEVAVGTGEGSASRVRAYLGKNFGGAEPATVQDLDPFAAAVLVDGVFVG